MTIHRYTPPTTNTIQGNNSYVVTVWHEINELKGSGGASTDRKPRMRKRLKAESRTVHRIGTKEEWTR